MIGLLILNLMSFTLFSSSDFNNFFISPPASYLNLSKFKAATFILKLSYPASEMMGIFAIGLKGVVKSEDTSSNIHSGTPRTLSSYSLQNVLNPIRMLDRRAF